MAKKKQTDESGEDTADKKKKKPIVPVVLVVIGLIAGKTFFGGGGSGPSPEELKAEAAAAKKALDDKCEAWNSDASADGEAQRDAASEDDGTDTATTETSAAAEEVKAGPVLEMTSTTINLADGHYLKMTLALQMPEGADAKLAKDEGKGAQAVDLAISHLQAKTMKELLPATARTEAKHRIGTEVCQAYEGEVLTVYFTEFVMQ